MSYATGIMKAALDHNEKRYEEFQKASDRPVMYCCGWTDSKIGEVTVNTSPVDIKVGLKRTFKKTWELDGKRISAEKLEKALNEAAK